MKHDWEYKKLGELGTIMTGNTPPTSNPRNYESKDICFVKQIDIEKEGVTHISKAENHISNYAYNNSCKRLPKGSVLTTCIGIIGKVGILEVDATCNQQINALVPKDELSSKYIAYALLSIKELMQSVANAPVVPIINKGQFASFCIPIPPLAIQEQIASELDKVSEIIDKKKQQMKELDTLAQSIFYDMFGDVNNNKYAYDIKKLIDVCELITDGTHQTPIYTDDTVNGVKFLSAKDVVSGAVNWDNIKYIPFSLHETLYARLAPRRNDLLLCKNGTTGIAAIVETDDVFDIYVSLALLRLKEGFLPKYVRYAINNPSTKQQFDESQKGVGVPNLHLGEIKKTRIIIPPLPLQQSFAQKIEAIEKQKEQINQSIKDVQTLFDARMDYWFGE